MKRISGLTVGMLLVVVGAGCAARSAVLVTPITVDLDPYTELLVRVESSIINDDDIEEDMISMTERIVGAVSDTERFPAVRAAESDDVPIGALVLTATITEIDRVGAAARALGGAIAGRAEIRLDATLTDGRGDLLGETEIVGQSGGTGFSGGTGEAMNEAANAIAEWLRTSGSE